MQALKPLIDLLAYKLPDKSLFNPKEQNSDKLKIKKYKDIAKTIKDRFEDFKGHD